MNNVIPVFAQQKHRDPGRGGEWTPGLFASLEPGVTIFL